MPAHSTSEAASRTVPDSRGAAGRVDPYPLAVGAIVLAQLAWLGVLAVRGWYYQDDLSFLFDARQHRLGWAYLSSPVNDHFVPGLRAMFWFLERFTGLDYGATIVIRLALQAAATILLYRLLVLLAGRRPGVLYATGWYAMCPLVMPGFLYLSASMNSMTAQVLIILAIDAHVRYTANGRLRHAAVAAVGVVGAALFWELSVLTAIVFIVLSLGFLHGGTFGERVRAELRRWPGWLMLAASLGAWLIVFVSGHYGHSTHSLSLSNVGAVVRSGWLDSLAPSLIGGPWRWLSFPHGYFGISDPGGFQVFAAQVTALAVLFVSWRRTGTRALVAWAIPAVTFVAGLALVAVGRFWFFHDLIGRQYTYLFAVAVPTAIGATLAFIATTPEDIARRAQALPGPPPTIVSAPARRLRPGLLTVAAICAFAGSSMISGLGFVSRWSQNPTQTYVHTLTTRVRAAGPSVSLYDSHVPSDILPWTSAGRRVSDMLALAHVPARFDAIDTMPLIVNDDGTLSRAQLVPAAAGIGSGTTACDVILRGAGQARIPLRSQPPANEYTLRLNYLQQRPSVIDVAIIDASGRTLAPARGQRTELVSPRLGTVTLRLPFANPRAVVVSSTSPATNVCLSGIVVGSLVPVQK